MATTDELKVRKPWLPDQPPWERHDGLFRFTVEQFYQMSDLGFFEDRHVELIRGVIYEMTQKPAHATSSQLTVAILRLIFGEGWDVRETKPLDTGRRSLFEPDFSVVAGAARDFINVHPKSAALVVEISETTLRKGLCRKAG